MSEYVTVSFSAAVSPNATFGHILAEFAQDLSFDFSDTEGFFKAAEVNILSRGVMIYSHLMENWDTRDMLLVANLGSKDPLVADAPITATYIDNDGLSKTTRINPGRFIIVNQLSAGDIVLDVTGAAMTARYLMFGHRISDL